MDPSEQAVPAALPPSADAGDGVPASNGGGLADAAGIASDDEYFEAQAGVGMQDADDDDQDDNASVLADEEFVELLQVTMALFVPPDTLQALPVLLL